jgi:hypothetical protein
MSKAESIRLRALKVTNMPNLVQALLLKENPFEHYVAETEPNIAEYAVKPPYFEAIDARAKNNSSYVLFGDRGAGKSATRLTVFNELSAFALTTKLGAAPGGPPRGGKSRQPARNGPAPRTMAADFGATSASARPRNKEAPAVVKPRPLVDGDPNERVTPVVPKGVASRIAARNRIRNWRAAI